MGAVDPLAKTVLLLAVGHFRNSAAEEKVSVVAVEAHSYKHLVPVKLPGLADYAASHVVEEVKAGHLVECSSK